MMDCLQLCRPAEDVSTNWVYAHMNVAVSVGYLINQEMQLLWRGAHLGDHLLLLVAGVHVALDAYHQLGTLEHRVPDNLREVPVCTFSDVEVRFISTSFDSRQMHQYLLQMTTNVVVIKEIIDQIHS